MKNIICSLLGKKEIPPKRVIPLEEIIFNVDNFNIWFNHPENGATYANSGIFKRIDKLSESHVDEYLAKCYGIENGAFLFSKPFNEMKSNFIKEIKKDWFEQITN
jgi:hypothetical protein